LGIIHAFQYTHAIHELAHRNYEPAFQIAKARYQECLAQTTTTAKYKNETLYWQTLYDLLLDHITHKPDGSDKESLSKLAGLADKVF